MTNYTDPNELICPLCGKDNRCAVSLGEPPESCWCRSTAISATALAAIPTASVGKICICAQCATEQGDLSK